MVDQSVALPRDKEDMSFDDVLSGEFSYEKSQVEKFQSFQVGKENFKDFDEQISGEIQSALESISELQKNKQELKEQLEARIDTIDREPVNDEGLDDLEVSELRNRLFLNGERRVAKWVYAFFLQRIRSEKFKAVLDSIDEKKVESDFMKRHREMLREERQVFENKLGNVTGSIEVLTQAMREEQRQNRKALEKALDDIGTEDSSIETGGSGEGSAGGSKTGKPCVLEKLKAKHRGDVDMTQKEIADECDVTQSRVSAIKAGSDFQNWLENQEDE